MRIFVSSSFDDLREHRAAAIRVLRQLGHQVLAMEDMTAGTSAPLLKVLEMVDRSDAYVGIFAWRYGYIPKPAATNPATEPAVLVPPVKGATLGETSITEYEYRRAIERRVPIMAFLLDENFSWPPQLVDGFDRTRTDAPQNADRIRALRLSLQQQRIVSWFTTPSDLEARVSAAVTTAGLSSQVNLQTVTVLSPGVGPASDSYPSLGITAAITQAQNAMKIDLCTTWWSTRLYLIASLAQRLTEARRILVVETKRPPLGLPLPPPDEQFIGQLPTNAILSVIGAKSPEFRKFEGELQARPLAYNDVNAEINALLQLWDAAFSSGGERAAAVDLTAEMLRRWFGDAMLTQALEIADLSRASAVDILRLLDYPNDFVPVLTRDQEPLEGGPAKRVVNVVDKRALNARLARSYLVELLDRARIV
jgi:hypothetical protein